MRFIFIYIVIAAAVMFALTSQGIKITQDSKVYIVTADLLASGDTETANQVMERRHAPPVYPYVLSLFRGNQPINYQGFVPDLKKGIIRNFPFVRVVSIVGFMLGVAGIFLLGWQVGSALTAHLSAIFFMTCWPMLLLYTYAWTEVLYIPLTIFGLFTLFKYEQEEKWYWWLASAAIAGLSLITRHIGLSLVIVGFVVVAHKSYAEPMKVAPWAVLALAFLALDGNLVDPRSTTYEGWKQFGYFFTVTYMQIGLLGIGIILLGAFLRVPVWWGIPLYLGLYLTFAFAQSWYRWIASGDTLRYLVPAFPFVLLYAAKVFSRAYQGCKGLAESA